MEVRNVTGTLSVVKTIQGSLSPVGTLSGTLSIEPPETEVYQGAYEFTPAAALQTIPTGGKLALQDIVINPIPPNYGLISWSGLGIRVS